MTSGSLIVDVVELRRRTGARRPLDGSFTADDLAVGERSVVGGTLRVSGHVEAATESVLAVGEVTGTWRVPCRRCLEPVEGPLVVDLHEVFEANPTEGETWPIDDERIDLGPVARELALLALPLTPVCRDDCTGPEPERFPTGLPDDIEPRRDDRWAALDALRFDE